jgi:hypothetical protein
VFESEGGARGILRGVGDEDMDKGDDDRTV